MKPVEYFVVSCIFFTILLHVASMNNTDICQLRYGDNVVAHTSYKDGNRACCKIITCDPGFEAVMCHPNEPDSTSCQPCPPNTFQSEYTSSAEMKYCDDKRSCPAGMKVEDDDSKVKDRRCLCDLEKGFCNTSKNRSNCQRRYCPTGMELNQDCSCTDCLDGYFKDVNGSMPCKQWRNCRDERRQQIADGTTATDAVCSNQTINNRLGGALPTTSTSTTTTAPSESSSPTRALPAEHSSESNQNSSSLGQTTATQNESSRNLLPVAIVTGIIALIAILVCIFLCIRFEVVKRIYARWKPDNPMDQPFSPGVDAEARLIEKQPNGSCQIADAQHREDLPERDVMVPLNAGDPAADHDDPPRLDNEIVAVVRHAPAPVVGPHSEMTCAMKRSLQECRVALLKNLTVSNVFLSVLGINGTITNEMREIIQSEPTSSDKTTRLLDYLLRRPCLSYRTFIFALVCTNQSNLAEQIDAELAEDYEARDIESETTIKDIVLSFGRL